MAGIDGSLAKQLILLTKMIISAYSKAFELTDYIPNTKSYVSGNYTSFSPISRKFNPSILLHF